MGTPLESALGTGGSAAVLGLLAVAGLVVLTRTPLRDAADRTVAGVRPLTSGVNQRLSTLFRLPYEDKTATSTEVLEPPDVPDDDTLVEPAEEEAKAKRGRRKKPKFVIPEDDAVYAEQLQIALGPAAKASPWKLPPVTLLDRAGSQQVDRRSIEETGRTLEKALADHGVETRLVGMVVGPTVTRYELELGPGVKVNRVTSLHKESGTRATPSIAN